MRKFLITGFYTFCYLLASYLIAEPKGDFFGDDILRFSSTGFFRVEKKDSVWWFVTPDGYAFYSMGVNHITPKGYYCPKLGYSPYERNILEFYGSEKKWAELTQRRLMDWRYNTIGAWSDYELFPRFPYVVQMHLSELKGGSWIKGSFPDVFDKEWEKLVYQNAQKICETKKNDPYLIGYFTDNELHFGPDWRNLKTLIQIYMEMSPESEGKKRLVDFFKERYKGDFFEFEKNYKTGAKNFDELGKIKKLNLGLWVYRKKIRNDVYAFDEIVAEKYFSTTAKAIRSVDPNHLILGSRFHSLGVSKGIIKKAGEWTDVLSVNYYYICPLQNMLPRLAGAVDFSSWLKKYYELSGKPILITEFSYRAITSGLPNTKGAPVSVFSQHDRALWFELYAKRCQKSSYIIGYHWFNYMDEPKEGRFDGENSNYGIVNEKDIDYKVLTERMFLRNSKAYKTHLIQD